MTLARNLTNIAFRLQRKALRVSRCREVEIPGRLRYVYLQGGHGDPLLLLHGFGANKDKLHTACRLPHAALSCDCPRSHWVRRVLAFGGCRITSPAAQAERVRAFMRALGIERFHLGGHSMGGRSR